MSPSAFHQMVTRLHRSVLQKTTLLVLPILFALLLFSLPRMHPFVFIAVCFVIAILYLFLPASALPAGEEGPLGWVGWVSLLFVVAVAAWFRMLWLSTVPAGYNCETLNWLASAAGFLKNGFSYVPYDWYAHNLYAYVLALGALFVSDEIGAVKLAGLFGGLATLMVFYAWMRKYTGPVGAWSAALLFAGSGAHASMNRMGTHHFLLPFFFATVFLGAWLTLNKRGWVGPLVTGIGVAGGLHAHWGFYYMPLVLVAWVATLPLLDRDQFPDIKKRLLWAAGFSLLFATPLAIYFLRRPDFFNYFFSWFSPRATFTTTFWEKYDRNLQGIVWALSGRMDARGTFEDTPYIAVVSAVLFFSGLVLLIRKSIAEPVTRLVAMTLCVGLIGMVATKMGIYWFMGIIVPVFTCIGVAADVVTRTVEELLPRRARFLPALLLLLILLVEVVFSFRAYRERGVFAHVPPPAADENGFYAFAASMKDDARQYSLFAPMGFRRRGFGTQFKRVSEILPSYEFIKEVKQFDDIPFFRIPEGGGMARGSCSTTLPGLLSKDIFGL